MSLFRKPDSVSFPKRTLLKTKDVKQLRKSLCSQFCGLDSDSIGELLPPKCQVECISVPSKVKLYALSDAPSLPLFFDFGGRGNYFPTVFCLWRFPFILRPGILPYPASKNIISGADVMLPGMQFSEDNNSMGFNKGEKAAVFVLGNPFPIAVGTFALSWDAALAGGFKGKGILVGCACDLICQCELTMTNTGGAFIRRLPLVLPNCHHWRTSACAPPLLYQEPCASLGGR